MRDRRRKVFLKLQNNRKNPARKMLMFPERLYTNTPRHPPLAVIREFNVIFQSPTDIVIVGAMQIIPWPLFIFCTRKKTKNTLRGQIFVIRALLREKIHLYRSWSCYFFFWHLHTCRDAHFFVSWRFRCRQVFVYVVDS